MSSLDKALRVLGRVKLATSKNLDVDRSAFYKDKWNESAEAAGLSVVDLGSGFLQISSETKSIRIHGSCLSVDDMISFSLVGNKSVSSRMLAAAGLPMVSETPYNASSGVLRSRLKATGESLVVKPASDTGAGKGITVGPTGDRCIAEAILEAGTFGTEVLLQERIDGNVVRALVADGELLDTVERRPAAVTGDGTSTVKDLVSVENARRDALGDRSTGYIPTGADYKAALARVGMSTKSVPLEGEEIVVSGRSNTGSELESSRIELEPAAAETAVQAAQALGVVLAGVDLVLDPEDKVLAVLEVNTCPGLHWHVLVNGEPAPIFDMVLSRFVGSQSSA